jgi:hypothetical protein
MHIHIYIHIHICIYIHIYVCRFESSFFARSFEDNKVKSSLISMKKTTRLGFEVLRSKCIYKLHRMGEVSVHIGRAVNSSYVGVIVPTDLVFMHHYREFLTGNGECNSPSDKREEDTVVKRYGGLKEKNKMYIAMLPYLGNITP